MDIDLVNIGFFVELLEYLKLIFEEVMLLIEGIILKCFYDCYIIDI